MGTDIATLVRRVLAEVCTVPVFLVFFITNAAINGTSVTDNDDSDIDLLKARLNFFDS